MQAAQASARPLNLYVVIAWDLIDLHTPHAQQSARLREHLRKLQQRRYGQAAFAYVEEACRWPHTNLLLYVAPGDEADFWEAMTGWLGQGRRLKSKAVIRKRVYDLEGLIAYLMKGGDDDVREAFCVKDEHRVSQGLVIGKRLGVSVGLGKVRAEPPVACARRTAPAPPSPSLRLPSHVKALFGSASASALATGEVVLLRPSPPS